MLFNSVKRFQSGGIIDTDAMKNAIKDDITLFKEGSYTASGRKRLAAIQAIEDNQKQGFRYIIDDANETFNIVDESGNVYHDRNLIVTGKRFLPEAV